MKNAPMGLFTVKLNLQDDMGELLGLQLMVPREDMAKAVATRFQKTPERLYSTLLSMLLQDEVTSIHQILWNLDCVFSSHFWREPWSAGCCAAGRYGSFHRSGGVALGALGPDQPHSRQ